MRGAGKYSFMLQYPSISEQVWELRRPSIEQRFWDKVEKTDTCWLWTGSKGKLGYGKFSLAGNKVTVAARVGYWLTYGDIPAGLDLDHLCRNPPCVKPEHLEPVSRQENINRGRNYQREKTHCPQGHPYDDANTHRYRNHRYCRQCVRERNRVRRATLVKP